MSCSLPDLVYVLGAGRSGTTLLDIVLGNGETTFSCGEIRKFLLLDGRPAGMGPGSANWQFWDLVRTDVYSAFTGSDRERLAAFARRIESHERFPFQFMRRSNRKGRDWDLYRQYVCVLLDSISRHSDASLLVDSSKYPGRALALMAVIQDRMKIIWIRRRRRDVVRSFRKAGIEQPSKGYVSANLYWLSMYMMCGIAYLRCPSDRRARVDFDCFVQKPTEVLEALGRDLGLDLSAQASKANKKAEFSTGWLFEGNRLRKLAAVVIRPPGESAAEPGTRVKGHSHQ